MDVNKLYADIEKIGNDVVNCARRCEGIKCDKTDGTPPRCLYFETENRAGNQGLIIVGMNPGKAGKRERADFKGYDWHKQLDWWEKNLKNRHPYYKGIRQLVDQLGFRGPILWTELAKCQVADDVKEPPLETFRRCVDAHLSKEVSVVPVEWQLVGVGREAFTALAYRYPGRPVLGICHPTGSHGLFHDLLKKRELNYAKAVESLRRDEAIWLREFFQRLEA